MILRGQTFFGNLKANNIFLACLNPLWPAEYQCTRGFLQPDCWYMHCIYVNGCANLSENRWSPHWYKFCHWTISFVPMFFFFLQNITVMFGLNPPPDGPLDFPQPDGGLLRPPITRLLGHVVTRGKRHSKERKKIMTKLLRSFLRSSQR